MFKEQMNKLKNMFFKKKEEEDDKTGSKKIENLVVFLILLIIVIIAINYILNEDKSEVQNEESAYKFLANNNQNEKEDDSLEKRLEKILGTISGVGNVNVLITYTQSQEVSPMYNENNTTSHTTETDSTGGTRTIEEQGSNKEVIFTDENGANVPATKTVINPKVEGVIVTAEGANNANVKGNIVEAVVAVTGVGAHKVQVFSMN